MRRLLQLYRDLPRAGRWLVWTGALLVAYFGLVEPVLDATARLDVEADRLEARLDQARREAGQRGQQLAARRLGMTRFGSPLLPGEPDVRAADLGARINEVLKAHGVGSHTSQASSGRLPEGPLPAALDGARIRTHIRDVQFNARPEVVTAVLADLESAPEVARVTRIDLTPADDRATRTIRASVTLEAWAIEARRPGA